VTTAEDIWALWGRATGSVRKPVATLMLADLDVVGRRSARTARPRGGGRRAVDVGRRGSSSGDDPCCCARTLGSDCEWPLSSVTGSNAAAAGRASGAPSRWSGSADRLRAVTFELLGAAAELGARLGAPVEAIVLGAGGEHAAALSAAGADRVLVADAPALRPYTTDAHARVLADAVRARAPRLLLLGSTAIGRDLAPLVAARLGLGLSGDAIGLELDAEGHAP
jgi:hypothetical protein